jgi:anti-anti-sigma factor
MVIFVEATHDVVVLRITSSDLTRHDQRPFQAALEPFLNSHRRLVLDMQDVRMVDGYGIGTLMSCLHQLRNKGGDLKMVHVAPPLRTFFEIARVSRMIEFHDSLPQALAAYSIPQHAEAPRPSAVEMFPAAGMSDCPAPGAAD